LSSLTFSLKADTCDAAVDLISITSAGEWHPCWSWP